MMPKIVLKGSLLGLETAIECAYILYSYMIIFFISKTETFENDGVAAHVRSAYS